MRRIKVEVRWDGSAGPLGSFVAVDPITKKPVPYYVGLSIGDTPVAQVGAGDDPIEALKTFADPKTVVDLTSGLQKMTDPSPAKAAVLTGWVTVPD